MINANEFRIGNGVKISDRCPCREEFFGTYKKVSLSVLNYPEYHDPIPLTPDILGKCGFVSNPYQDRYELGDLHFEHCGIRGIVWCEKYPHIKYLHQLQNLVFFTKETELNYTP